MILLNFVKKNFSKICIFLSLVLVLFYLNYNLDFFLIKINPSEKRHYAQFLEFSWVNNTIYIFLCIIFFITILFIIENLRESIDFYFRIFLLIILLFIFIILNLPFDNILEINNFSDLFHESERIGSIINFSFYNFIEVISNYNHPHGIFMDYLLGTIALNLFGLDGLILGTRIILSFTYLFLAISILLFIFLYVLINYKYNKFNYFIIFILISLFLLHTGLISFYDRHIPLVLALIPLISINYIVLKKIDYVKFLFSCLIIFLSLFFNFYQFVMLNISLIIFLLSTIRINKSLLIIYSVFNIFLFFIFSLFFFEILIIKFNIIFSTYKNYGTQLIFDIRDGYSLANGLFQYIIYIISLSLLIFLLIKNFYKKYSNFNFNNLFNFINENLINYLLLIFSLSGFFEFNVRGLCCSAMHKSSFLHYLVLTNLIINFLNEKKI